MRRRDFSLLLAAGAAWPLFVGAELPGIPVVGYMAGGSHDEYTDRLSAFLRGLRDEGYVAGANVVIEYRWAEGRYERLPQFAAEFVRRRVIVIAASSLPAALAAKAATSTIPIVFSIGGDPVSDGLVAALSRPGANMTGVTNFFGALAAKRLEVLRELVPAPPFVAVLINSKNPNAKARLADVEDGARATAQPIRVFHAASAGEIDAAVAASVRQGARALLIADDPLFVIQRRQVVALAARHALPTVHFSRQFVAVGGLVSYGPDLAESSRQFARYIGRVLKGEKPQNLPVMQPTKFELVINLKTAKALGVAVPPVLLARADEVIE